MTTIVHTTDLLDRDAVAFEHSVALAMRSGAALVALHANASPEAVARMPDADAVLRRWGREPGSVSYRAEIHTCCDDPIDTVLDGLRKLEPDLVVATSHDRGILARIFGGSGAEAIAHNLTAPVMLFPAEVDRGFVTSADGGPAMARIVVPAGDVEAARVALDKVRWLAKLTEVEDVEVVLLCVGDVDAMPELQTPDDERLRVVQRRVGGSDVCAAIVEHSREASLIVMATRGHDSIGDVLRGSKTDRVLHRVGCPVLSVKI